MRGQQSAEAVAKEQKYRRRIKEGLDAAFHRSPEVDLDLDRAKLIIFSDHHRGARDGADDFWRCERAYRAALGHYLESGYRLVLLGDVEELWENKPGPVMREHADTLELEAEFHRAGRLDRFWGNHDLEWREEGEVRKHLAERFTGLAAREALRLRVVSDREMLGVLFLVHGHQGTLESDRFGGLARIPVRYLWRPIQRRFKIASTTPARKWDLRENHDRAMYEWAKGHPEKPVLIAGHTHRPVFGRVGDEPGPQRGVDDVRRDLDELRSSPDASSEALAQLRAEYEFVRVPAFEKTPEPLQPPCYFNTGCCSYGDGDVTGLEIANGKIRLVRWLNDEFEPKPKELASRDLRDVFREVVGMEGETHAIQRA
jgi:hypothetical protein